MLDWLLCPAGTLKRLQRGCRARRGRTATEAYLTWYVAGSRPDRNEEMHHVSASRLLLVVIAWGSHPFPSRTRPLSPTARMVLLVYPVGEYVAASFIY